CRFLDKNESNLSSEEIEFITNLDLLDVDEEIQMFESNSGFNGSKESGNLITNKRLSHYWIKDDVKDVDFAFYYEIDSMILKRFRMHLTLRFISRTEIILKCILMLIVLELSPFLIGQERIGKSINNHGTYSLFRFHIRKQQTIKQSLLL
ncbi:MAG: hypothetical protein MK066_12790, partial [Crocinitomicaceae bacterium]|nr:hypothetical protein [Crocinitomicaceae bacterium]